MKIFSSKTPLIAAFFLATLLGGCHQDNVTRTAADTTCGIDTTPIASVQGSGSQSDMVGQLISVQGIITGVYLNRGVYIEEPDSDDDNRTSNAIFVETSDASEDVQPGMRVLVQGTVAELQKGRNSLTALTNTNGLQICARDQDLPLTPFELPMKGLDREAIEAMRVSHSGTLTITDNYNLNRGRITVSGNGVQYTATELMLPGDKADKHTSNNQTFTLPLLIGGPVSDPQSFKVGASLNDTVGIMWHDRDELRLTVTSSTEPLSNADFQYPPETATGASRVVSINLYNYFNGDGLGGGFPNRRGAQTSVDFASQRRRIGAALNALKPQLVAVMELENDGFGPNSATADLIALLNSKAGGVWATARPEHDNTGDDAIKVAIFYRSDLWQPQGSARTLSGPEFKKSRQPLAQVFNPIGGGESLLLAVNHFKSKGSCPDDGPDANQKDGQGCWSAMRTRSAELMTAWVKSLAVASQTDNTLIMGDLNSYRREAPIDAIRAAGFTELMDSANEKPFSYMYYGQAGTLDYAFVSPALDQKVQNAFIWQVNSIMPGRVYFYLPQPWLRFSDHDPVVVDLSLRH